MGHDARSSPLLADWRAVGRWRLKPRLGAFRRKARLRGLSRSCPVPLSLVFGATASGYGASSRPFAVAFTLRPAVFIAMAVPPVCIGLDRLALVGGAHLHQIAVERALACQIGQRVGGRPVDIVPALAQ